MANDQVTIHDPFSNHNNLTSSTNCDLNSTSDQDSMADTVELRMMMAYATRRRPKQKVESPTQDTPSAPNGVAHSNGPSSPPTPDKTEEEGEEKKKKKRKMKKKKEKNPEKIAPVDTTSSLLCECKWLISHDMTMSERIHISIPSEAH